MKALFSKGQMIYWCDPDDGLCSGPGTFVEYFGHDDARIVKDGGVIEVCASELGPVPISSGGTQ